MGKDGKKRRVDWAKWIKRALAAAFVGAVGWGVIYSFMPQPVMADAREVEQGTMEVTVDEDGRTRVIDHYVVSTPLGGNLARIDLRPGDQVKAGDVVARIEPSASPLMDTRSRAETEARLAAAEAAVRQAQATEKRAEVALAFAKKKLDDTKGLAAKGSVSNNALELAQMEKETREQDLASAKFGERVARGEVNMAKAVLERLDGKGADDIPEGFEVIAPADGRVLEVLQKNEGPVAPGQPLLGIADPLNLEVVADVLTTDAVDVDPGDRVYVEDWGGDVALEGRVRMVEPSAFTRVSALGVEEQRVNVLIDLLTPPEARKALGDGYRVEVRIVVWRAEDVIQVPTAALFRDGEGWAVYTVVDGQARARPVKIGQRHGLVAEVLEGLTSGEQVVVHPDDAVRDGTALQTSP